MVQRYSVQCSACKKKVPFQHLVTTCPECQRQITIRYDLNAIAEALDKSEIKRRRPGVWKYFEFLPLSTPSHIISLGEGGTFLQKCNRLAKILGIKDVYVKNETTNPTGSFIDRGMTILVSKAVEAQINSLSCFPTGNLGASLAAYSAKADIICKISLSTEIDLGKLYQMIAYNADIQLEDKQKNTAWDNEQRDFCVTPSNRFLIEGEKTIAYELCEQLDWHPPSRIISPMGTGGLISMIWRGLKDLKQIDFIDQESPMITGVQAEGCCPIVEAYQNQSNKITPLREAKTLAVDIKVGHPPFGDAALKSIHESKGSAIAVSDREIIDAIRLLAKTEGVFAEPSAASTIAGLKKLIKLRKIDEDEQIVCIITGAGLKDPSVVERLVEDRRKIKTFIYGVEVRRLTKLGGTKLTILQILSERNLHGYGIWKKLKEEYLVKISVPSVYQHLSELEALNLLKSGELQQEIGERTRRYYTLTKKGKTLQVNS